MRKNGKKIVLLNLDFEGKLQLFKILEQINDPTVNLKLQAALSNIYLSSEIQNYKADQQKIFNAAISEILAYMDQLVFDKKYNGYERFLELIKTILSQFYGLTYLAIDLNKNKSMLQINFVFDDNGIKTSFRESFASNMMVGQMKRYICEKKDIGIFNIKFFSYNGNMQIALEGQDETSLANQFQNNGEVQILAKVLSRYSPKNELLQNNDVLLKFFNHLVLINNNQTLSLLWAFISSLPKNTFTKNQIETFKFDWNLLIKNQNFYSELYVIGIIQQLISEKQDTNWLQQFLSSDWPKLLVEHLIKLDFQLENNNLHLNMINQLAYIVAYCNQNSLKHKGVFSSEYLYQKVISIFFSLSQFISNRDQKQSAAEKTKQEILQAIKNKKKQNSPQNEEAEALNNVIQLIDGLKINALILKCPKDRIIKFMNESLLNNNNNQYKEQFSLFLSTLEINHRSLILQLMCEDMLTEILQNDQINSTFFFSAIIKICDKGANVWLQQNFVQLITRMLAFLNDNKIHSLESIVGSIQSICKIVEKITLGEIFCMEIFKQVIQILIPSQPPQLDNMKQQKKINSYRNKSQCRQGILNIIFELIKQDKGCLEYFVKFVCPLVQLDYWRTKSFQDWNVVFENFERENNEFVGLQNLDCICYMNSLFQQLFMIPSFKNCIMNAQDSPNNPPKEENILYQLKCLFAYLQFSNKQYYNPQDFCHAFKDLDGNPTNIFEQMDADEFFIALMDKIEQSIKDTPDKDLVKDHFGGTICNEIICKTCPHQSAREESFFALNLIVKNKKNIRESLQTLIAGDILEGENSYHCDKCDKKVSAVKRTTLKKLPNYLILALKRFEFDYDTMGKIKINDKCEFPFDLDIYEYSEQAIKKSEGNPLPIEQQMQKDYFEYKLRGIVIHLGFADSGHYYSYIIDKEQGKQNWFEFNDQQIREIDVKDIPSETYGGEEKQKQNYSSKVTKDKIRNAYILFYERECKYQNDKKINRELINLQPDSNEIIPFIEQVIKENELFHYQRFIYNQQFFNFIEKLLDQTPFKSSQVALNYPYQLTPDNPDFISSKIIQMIINFTLTCAIREKSKKWFLKNIDKITNLAKSQIHICQWVVCGFSFKQIIDEMILENPCKKQSKQIIYFLAQCMIQLDSNPETISVAYELLEQWTQILEERTNSNKNDYLNMFYLFDLIMKKSEAYRIKLYQNRLLKITYEIYLEVSGLNAKILSSTPQTQMQIEQREYDKQLFFGQKKTIQQKVSSHYDDLLQKKFEKHLKNYEEININKTYLLPTLSQLIQYAKQSKQKLSPQETKYLTLDFAVITSFFDNCVNKVCLRAVSKILQQLCENNQSQSELIINAVAKFLREKEYKEYRKCLIPTKNVLMIDDSLHHFRIQSYVSQILTIFEEQKQYLFETNIVLQYLIRFCFRIPDVYSFLHQNVQKIKWVYGFLNDPKTCIPGEKLMVNNRLKDKTNHRMHMIYLPIESKGYNPLIKWLKEKVQEIETGKMKMESLEVNTDEDLENFDVKQGDDVDLYVEEQNMWKKGKIVEVCGSQFKVGVGEKEFLEERDSQYLSCAGNLSRNAQFDMDEEGQTENQTQSGNSSENE